MKRSRFCLISFLFMTSIARADLPPLNQRVVEHTCTNGVKLLILERHFSPTVSVRMMFRVGSADEVSGKTGLAHMFEHMMFKGTPTIGSKDYAKESPLLDEVDRLNRTLDAEKDKGQAADQNTISQLIDQIHAAEQKAGALVVDNALWNLYEREGAIDLNAQTSHDFTQYTIDLPSNKWTLWSLLDADRVRHPVFRQFYQERDVVKEERRMRVDTDPQGKLYEMFLATAYTEHPYRHPVIGWESDIDRLSVADLEDFYHRYYTPDRLIIAVVGDVKAADVIAQVDKDFGSWQAPALPRREATPEASQNGLRRVGVKLAAQPEIVMGFHIPTYPDPQHVAVYALSELLGSGNTSRLYKALVENGKLASEIGTSTDYPGERYPTLLVIDAKSSFPHTLDDIQKAVDKEIDRLKRRPIEAWELEKVRSEVEVGLLNQLQTNAGMASALVYDETVFGHWRYLLEFQKQIEGLTAVQIQDAAKKFLTIDNETIAVLEPLPVKKEKP